MSTYKHDSARRLALFKRMGIFQDLPHGFRVKRATTEEEYRDAFALIYNRYQAKGYIPANPYGMRVRKYDTRPDTILCVVYEKEEIQGTMALIPDSPEMGIPADQIFSGEIAALRKQFSLLSEYTGMALREGKKSRSILMEMIRCLLWHSYKSGQQAGVMMISPAHKPFFSFFGCEQIGKIQNARSDGNDPVILMYWNPIKIFSNWSTPELGGHERKNFLKQYLLEENPYREIYEVWEKDVRELFSCPGSIANIFRYLWDKMDKNAHSHDIHNTPVNQPAQRLRGKSLPVNYPAEKRISVN